MLANDAYGDGATRLVYLDQGWGPLETLWFYHADQGSVLMPYDTLVHLEQADNEKPFILPENMTRFRFLNQRKTQNNPDALPVGFTRHEDKVGLTCAACQARALHRRDTGRRQGRRRGAQEPHADARLVRGLYLRQSLDHCRRLRPDRRDRKDRQPGDPLQLKSPLWPEKVLPPIDRALAARGEGLYRASCISCHAAIDRDDPRRSVTAIITAIDVVGTDATSARNLVTARAPTGVLEGAISPRGEKYGAEAGVLALVADLATRTVAANPVAALKAIGNAKLHRQEKTPKQGNHASGSDQNPLAELMSYKARPLNGIWASAPYLHNGSVPTLYDLLLPPAERPAKFSVGRWEYDPRKVGYVSDGEVPFVLDTGVTGNSNRGHEYGVKLADEDRWALVEYLKTL